MHRQLRYSDVAAIDGDFGIGDVAQGRAAMQVASVGIFLVGYSGLLGNRLYYRSRHGIRGVGLSGAVFDHNSFAKKHLRRLVGYFRMVGMVSVGVVDAQGKGRGNGPLVFPTKTAADPLQGILKEGGVGPLLSQASHLLIVESSKDRKTTAFLSLQESQEGGIAGGKVVELRRREILPVESDPSRLVAVGQEEVEGKDAVLVDGKLVGEELVEVELLHADQGKHVLGGIEAHALVDGAVHVNAEVRNQKEVPVRRKEEALKLSFLLDNDPSRDGQGPVHPGGVDHATIGLDVEDDSIDGLDDRIGFDLEGRGIGVDAGEDKSLLLQIRRRPESDEAGAVPRHEIALAGLQLLAFRLEELLIAFLEKPLPEERNDMERRIGPSKVIDDLIYIVHKTFFPSLPGRNLCN